MDIIYEQRGVLVLNNKDPVIPDSKICLFLRKSNRGFDQFSKTTQPRYVHYAIFYSTYGFGASNYGRTGDYLENSKDVLDHIYKSVLGGLVGKEPSKLCGKQASKECLIL